MVHDMWKKILIGGILVISVIGLLIGFLVGFNSLKSFFTGLMIFLLIITALAGAFYVVWLIFFAKNFKDIPAQFKKKLFSVTKVMANDMLGKLFLSGDTKHNRISLGKYFYLRINMPKLIKDENDDNIDPKSMSEAIPVDCFIVKRDGFLNRMFSEPFFVLVRPEDHDHSSIFNDVTIKGFNLVPLDSQFYTIDSRNLDTDLQKSLHLNYIREVVFSIFADLDRLVKQAMNLDQQFQKDKEKAREFEIPQLGNLGGAK